MQMLLCPNCGKLTGFKRALGFGTFFMVLLTAGLWLLVIPFYPARCITCGLTRGSAFAHNFATWYRGLSQGARVFVVLAPLALLFGLGIFSAFKNTTQRNSPPLPSSSMPQGSDLFKWPTEGLPAYIADALGTPDLAPISPADGARELVLGVAGQKQVIPAVNDSDCEGSGGCVWEIKDAATKRELLGDSQGVLHKTQKITNGYYDLLVEDKWELNLYEYHGGKYKNTVCYGRSNGLGSSAILTQCQEEDQSTAAPKASMGYPVSEEIFLNAYVLANLGRDDLSKDQLIQLGHDEYTMGLQIDTQTLLMGGDLLNTRAKRAMVYLYQHSNATSEQPAPTGTAAQPSGEGYPGAAHAASPIPQATSAEARTDGQIEMDVLHALGANSALKDTLITAATAQGEVTLSGTVPNESCRELAELIAKYVPGVARVHNNLTVGIPQGAGNGYGPGYGWNTSGGVYQVGGRISAPVLIYQPEADYSDEARRARLQGVCVVDLIVDASGNPQSVHVVRTLEKGLDEKAVEAVRRYRFKPAMLDGKTPVPVMITVEVDFHLY